MILIEDIHYPNLRSLSLSELINDYNICWGQYWRNAQLWKKHKVGDGAMTVYAEYMNALWEEIERRAEGECQVELLEKVYTELMA